MIPDGFVCVGPWAFHVYGVQQWPRIIRRRGRDGNWRHAPLGFDVFFGSSGPHFRWWP